MQNKSQDLGAISGSRASHGAAKASPPFGFDPERGGRDDWDDRPLPGQSNADPMCINLYCPSAFSCRRFSHSPYQGGPATIFIDPRPDLLRGLLCSDFDPASVSPADSVRAAYAIAAGTRSAETRSKAQPEGCQSVIAQKDKPNE